MVHSGGCGQVPHRWEVDRRQGRTMNAAAARLARRIRSSGHVPGPPPDRPPSASPVWATRRQGSRGPSDSAGRCPSSDVARLFVPTAGRPRCAGERLLSCLGGDVGERLLRRHSARPRSAHIGTVRHFSPTARRRLRSRQRHAASQSLACTVAGLHRHDRARGVPAASPASGESRATPGCAAARDKRAEVQACWC